MSEIQHIRAVTFDAGQTLVELDTSLLASRVEEQGALVSVARLDDSTSEAWSEYAAALSEGQSGEHAWKRFMRRLLSVAEIAPHPQKREGVQQRPSGELAQELTEWLWREQPVKNLWRRPVRGMFELARELREHHIPVGILSNSEGKLAALIDELGQLDAFDTVTDSGVVGCEKPAPEIFHLTAKALGVAAQELLHIGDSFEADIRGALGVGAEAIWFNSAGFEAPPPSAAGGFEPVQEAPASDPRMPTSVPSVRRATTAFELREHFCELGLL
ncbi:MAG: HAD family hydrolase [Polyangiaceae bacterium]|nr:HAD family hydrolase [Myxococcales bacterium]MCB9586080.1 HAD family hydrolase [Polyangiaceae bacterium]MCB9608903.1 HAD family hydrolase [Polyangiaceae bacterium]